VSERHALIPVFPLSDEESSTLFIRGMEVGAHMIRMMVDESYSSRIRHDNADAIRRCAVGMGAVVEIGEPDDGGWCDVEVSRNDPSSHN